jgi:cobalt-zinc-cadmium efflux system membrane fusion protein
MTRLSFKILTKTMPAAILAAALGGCGGGGSDSAADTATERCAHEIKRAMCPFCTPSLIDSDGFCGEHGVAEALCYQCRPFLKAAFRAKGDWCAEHSAPESQCMVCHPELKERIRPGEHGKLSTSAAGSSPSVPLAGGCEHGIETANCPFCTPSLIASEGFCAGHNVPEALCVRCRPYLHTAFKAKGDWCAEHNTPESQCVICHPDLNRPAGAGQG